jgi:CheY-like chemotaxis protein/two-component sensor histidine kinase
LIRLVDDLLDVQRFTHGVIDLKTEALEIGLLIEDVIEATRASAEAETQPILVEPPSERLYILADAARLTQVISNLLINAIKYSPSKSEIVLSWSRDGNSVAIRIKDNGIGMSQELVSRVFEPFVQGNRDLSRSQGGLGLGLTMVKRLVELHGGTVAASSAGAGRGSEFLVRIPLLAEQDRTVTIVPCAKPREPTRSKRVLVVDDNEDSARTLRAQLERRGHVIEVAKDGAEALSLALSQEPEAIVLDIGLPILDGYEVARRIRLSDSLQHCRLIALTGYGTAEDRERCRAAGFDSHLIKPVDLSELLDVLEARKWP